MTKRTTTAASNFKVGDLVVLTGCNEWLCDKPVTIISFGEKRGAAVADLSDGQWAYVDELRKA